MGDYADLMFVLVRRKARTTKDTKASVPDFGRANEGRGRIFSRSSVWASIDHSS
jgi:hypothetical protein